jgi:hypothetical protein
MNIARLYRTGGADRDNDLCFTLPRSTPHRASYPFLRGAGLCVAGFLCARSEAATLLTAFDVFGLESSFPAFEASFPLVGIGGTSAGVFDDVRPFAISLAPFSAAHKSRSQCRPPQTGNGHASDATPDMSTDAKSAATATAVIKDISTCSVTDPIRVRPLMRVTLPRCAVGRRLRRRAPDDEVLDGNSPALQDGRDEFADRASDTLWIG